MTTYETPEPYGRRDAGVPEWLGRLLAAVRSLPEPEDKAPGRAGPGSGPRPGPGSGPRPGPNPAADGAARAAAVLILFGAGRDGPDLLLIQRSATVSSHPGQPAFPGGAVDPEDDGPVGAALREAAEETGLDPAGVDVLATLPELHVSRSGYRVTPVLAWWRAPCAVSPGDPAEVAAVARVPLAVLADPANRLRVRHPGGTTGPAFRAAGMLVWGFTAAVLDRLLTLGGWERPWDANPAENLPPDVLTLARRG